ncbi:hypothetical protein [Hyphomicrobium sp.]|uniref:hypothetical protein n=1 Tax=Hyphomicrobium sp. TaxID=82 RepID=UPI0025C3411F|nr:hypothetical protein [Hyphomicrobium sp.]
MRGYDPIECRLVARGKIFERLDFGLHQFAEQAIPISVAKSDLAKSQKVISTRFKIARIAKLIKASESPKLLPSRCVDAIEENFFKNGLLHQERIITVGLAFVLLPVVGWMLDDVSAPERIFICAGL